MLRASVPATLYNKSEALSKRFARSGPAPEASRLAGVQWLWYNVSNIGGCRPITGPAARLPSQPVGNGLMSKKHPECPLYNPLNCKEYHNPKVCAFVRKDKACLKRNRKDSAEENGGKE